MIVILLQDQFNAMGGKKKCIKNSELNYKYKYNGSQKKSDSFGKHRWSVIEKHYSMKLTLHFKASYLQELYLSGLLNEEKPKPNI